MLKIYYKGKLRRILGIQVGDKQVAAWYDVNKRKIWPDDSARSNALRVKLPERGTEDWAYWVHAVDALRTLGARDDCYMYLEIGGKKYYLIDSPDGSEPMQLEGNSIYFAGDADFPTEGIGGKARVSCHVPFRPAFSTLDPDYSSGWDVWLSQMDNVYDRVANEPSGVVGIGDSFLESKRRFVGLPIIADASVLMKTEKGFKDEPIRSFFEVRGYPNGQLLMSCLDIMRAGRGEYGGWHLMNMGAAGDPNNSANDYFTLPQGNRFVPGDTGYEVVLRMQGQGCYGVGFLVRWPEFSRTWELEIESVNDIAL